VFELEELDVLKLLGVDGLELEVELVDGVLELEESEELLVLRLLGVDGLELEVELVDGVLELDELLVLRLLLVDWLELEVELVDGVLELDDREDRLSSGTTEEVLSDELSDVELDEGVFEELELLVLLLLSVDGLELEVD